jgi:HD-GYP domain-containing protein (c-di-GMP phosphodiesterase class II)
MRAHPVIGAELIMRMTEWGELSARMTEGAFEHHLRYDLTGYPRLAQKKKVTLFGRIVSIADFYDALARPRGTLRFPYVSEKILEIMLERRGKDFDPGIVKVFINMIGAFPLGTLALLNTHEMGIVTRIQEDTELLDRPEVCLIYYGDGEYRKGKVVDLGERDGVSGDFKRSIVKTVDPNEYNINVAEFFL